MCVSLQHYSRVPPLAPDAGKEGPTRATSDKGSRTQQEGLASGRQRPRTSQGIFVGITGKWNLCLI